MNYRHAYHAGNFADVVKHAVLCRALVHLREKPAAFRVIDTHAGAGVYDLAGIRSRQDRRMAATASAGCWRPSSSRRCAALLAPYLDAVTARNPDGALRLLSRLAGPGAGADAAAGPADRLRARAAGRGRARPRAAIATRAPSRSRSTAGPRSRPMCRRRSGAAWCWSIRRSSSRAISPAWCKGWKPRTANGRPASIMLWYPIKDAAEVTAFTRKLARLGIAKTLRAELIVSSATDDLRLRGTGLIVVNPPWMLHERIAGAAAGAGFGAGARRQAHASRSTG